MNRYTVHIDDFEIPLIGVPASATEETYDL